MATALAPRTGTSDLNGIRKAAILTVLIGEEASGELFKHLNEEEIEAQLDAAPNDGDRRQPVLTRRMVNLANSEPESAAKLVRGWLAEGERG